MRLTAKIIPFSSTVSGGLSLVDLVDEAGCPRFMVLFCGTTDGISGEQSDTISQRLAELINEHGLTLRLDGED